MIDINNKYEILRQYLHIGEKLNSTVIKKIAENRAVINLKGYHVIVETDQPLIENSMISFFISGLNNRNKTILLKLINNYHHVNSFHKLQELKNYLKEFLIKNQIPINQLTLDIVNYILLKDNYIDKEKVLFIFQNLKYWQDISFLYKLYSYELTSKNVIFFLTLYERIKENNTKTTKVKNNLTDNKDVDKRFIVNENKINTKQNLKFVFDNHNLGQVLLQENNFESILFLLYPILINSHDEMGYLFLFPVNDEMNFGKLNIHFIKDMLFFKIEIEAGENKINYQMILMFKEKRSILLIRNSNIEYENKMKNKIDQLKIKLNNLLKMEIEIYFNESGMKEDKFQNFNLYA